ncbi:MAG: hypothetical protein ACRDIB_08870, partial [Ardenticatenaceae bacterium]
MSQLRYQFTEIGPDNTIFIMASFEGPDPYSRAGGLGVRASELSEALAQAGFESHLFFVGAPDAPNHEVVGENYHLWRVSQKVSRRCPQGVYQAEDEKLAEFEETVPPLILSE